MTTSPDIKIDRTDPAVTYISAPDFAFRPIEVRPPYTAFGGEQQSASVNWGAIGSVHPSVARVYAACLTAAADEADALNGVNVPS